MSAMPDHWPAAKSPIFKPPPGKQGTNAEMREGSPKVVVVGGGPAGAALAFVLARNGVHTTLLERHANFAREFRGEGLQPSGVDCLVQMGLAEPLAAIPQTRIGKILYGIAGRVIEVPLELAELEQVRLISQPDLLAMVTREAAAFPNFTLRMAAVVRELERDASGRVIGVRLAGGEVVPADFVIATDGRNSVVRKRLGLELIELEQAFDVLWMRGPLEGPLALQNGSYVDVMAGGGMAMMYPSPAGGHQIGVIIRKGGFRDVRDTGLEWLRERCSSEFWAMLERASDRLERPVLLDVICGRAPKWSAPGVLLIGDAAHPMSPVGGQGINMALRDAVVAANHLVPILREGADPAALDRAAAAVEAERMPEIVPIQTLQTKRGKRFDRKPGAMELRFMSWVLGSKRLVRLLMRQRVVFGHGQTEVALRV
jgi:2-polyprenyl-6-methoxyphenol hydroxylase-like FAD-dependent oxidoreductase